MADARWRPGWPVALGIGVTLLVVVVPVVPAASEQPVLRVVIDTVVALVAVLLAYLLYGRFLLQRRSRDLVLAGTLALAALVNGGLGVAPQLLAASERGLTVLAWGPAVGRLVVAGGFAAAALVPSRSTVALRRPGWLLLAAPLLVAACIAAALLAASDVLPAAAVATLEQEGAQRRGQEPLLAGLRWLSAGLYGIAAAAFSRRTDDDPLRSALVAACLLQVFARANYALVPSVGANLVYAGDLLRLAAYAVLLSGAFGEIRRYWSVQAQRAVEQERRLLARSLHDGMAQELALLATQTRLWARGRQAMEPRLLAGAAERALDESRAVIHALTGPLDESLDSALLRLVDDLQGRIGLPIQLDLQPVPRLAEGAQAAVLRAAREALVNAGQHAQASNVRIRLTGGDAVTLTVHDDGHGFDPAAAGEGFGLAVARSRLDAEGGTVQVRSATGGGGTVVEARVPWTG